MEKLSNKNNVQPQSLSITLNLSLKFLGKIEINDRMKFLFKNERMHLCEVLRTVKEIADRHIYLELGYATLFCYLVDEIGYSKGTAQRRMDGAALLTEIPALEAKILSGEVKLHQVTLLNKVTRQVFKNSKQKVTTQQKEEILDRIAHKDFRDSQAEMASFFDLPLLQESRQTVQADGSVRIEMTLSKELYEKVKTAQALLSHAVASNDLTEYLEYVTERVIKQKTSVRSAKSGRDPVTAEEPRAKDSLNLENSGQFDKKPESKSEGFSARQRKIVLQKQDCCQFVDATTHKQCDSRWFLQVDHKHSRWAGGSNDLDNAQILCGEHNRMKYQREAQMRFTS